MGYETKLIIGAPRPQTSMPGDTEDWFQVDAILDLCKCWSPRTLDNRAEGRPVYFYAEDGNTRVTVDEVDEDPLWAVPIVHVLDRLDQEITSAAGGDLYARFVWARDLLRSMIDPANGHARRPTHVVLYGH